MAVALTTVGLRRRLLSGPNGVAATELFPLPGSARARARAQPGQRARGDVDDDLAPASRLRLPSDPLEGAAEDGGQAVVDADRPRCGGGIGGGPRCLKLGGLRLSEIGSPCSCQRYNEQMLKSPR